MELFLPRFLFTQYKDKSDKELIKAAEQYWKELAGSPNPELLKEPRIVQTVFMSRGRSVRKLSVQDAKGHWPNMIQDRHRKPHIQFIVDEEEEE
jgi:hypothetical protein